eukprot:TRINITY_DN198_c0_g1_i8.p1 TRINITY_DN198_c0_g1~~TRINITY_DN198_c0_g1_i8.p1  ORF type:complete len:2515 (+),score=224.21 TRINITY_DN198_c0_g1_i8:121-7545(+)
MAGAAARGHFRGAVILALVAAANGSAGGLVGTAPVHSQGTEGMASSKGMGASADGGVESVQESGHSCRATHGAVITVTGFTAYQLNGYYVRREDKRINGQPSYWDPTGMRVMYWCPLISHWAFGNGQHYFGHLGQPDQLGMFASCFRWGSVDGFPTEPGASWYIYSGQALYPLPLGRAVCGGTCGVIDGYPCTCGPNMNVCVSDQTCTSEGECSQCTQVRLTGLSAAVAAAGVAGIALDGLYTRDDCKLVGGFPTFWHESGSYYVYNCTQAGGIVSGMQISPAYYDWRTQDQAVCYAVLQGIGYHAGSSIWAVHNPNQQRWVALESRSWHGMVTCPANSYVPPCAVPAAQPTSAPATGYPTSSARPPTEFPTRPDPTKSPTGFPMSPGAVPPSLSPSAVNAVNLLPTDDCVHVASMSDMCYGTAGTYYRNNAKCVFLIHRPVVISVWEFETEGCCDKLTVDGVPYAGDEGPDGVLARTRLEWETDHSLTQRGWLICLVEPSTESPTGSPERDSAPPTPSPSGFPSGWPTKNPTGFPSRPTTGSPTGSPSRGPSGAPTAYPTLPTGFPSGFPSRFPTVFPTTRSPTGQPTSQPTVFPSATPSGYPSVLATEYPTAAPSTTPSAAPSGVCSWSEPIHDSFVPGCHDGRLLCDWKTDFELAKQACCEQIECGGITERFKGLFELRRRGRAVPVTNGEVGQTSWLITKMAAVAFEYCEMPRGWWFGPTGTVLTSPCPDGHIGGMAWSNGNRHLFSCMRGGTALCHGDASNPKERPVLCVDAGNMGCNAVYDVAFSSNASTVFAACGDKVTRCDWDPRERNPATNCVEVGGVRCPEGTQLYGVTLPMDNAPSLVLSCHSSTISAGAGILVCPSDGWRLLARCKREPVSPCGAGNFGNSAIDINSAGKLIVGCQSARPVYCDFDANGGMSQCGPPPGTRAPCRAFGVSEAHTGRSFLGCGDSGLHACGPIPPESRGTAAPAQSGPSEPACRTAPGGALRIRGLTGLPLNGLYVRDDGKKVHGHESYWLPSGDYFMYACPPWWLIADGGLYGNEADPDPRSELAACTYLANVLFYPTSLSAEWSVKGTDASPIPQPGGRAECDTACDVTDGSSPSATYPCTCGAERTVCVHAQTCTASTSSCSDCPVLQVEGLETAVAMSSPLTSSLGLDGEWTRDDCRKVGDRETYWHEGGGWYIFRCSLQQRWVISRNHTSPLTQDLTGCVGVLRSRTSAGHGLPIGITLWEVWNGQEYEHIEHNNWYQVFTCVVPPGDVTPQVCPTAAPVPPGARGADLEPASCSPTIGAFMVHGSTRAHPCRSGVPHSVTAAGRRRRIFACDAGGAVLCDGDGTTGPNPVHPALCVDIGRLGCPRTVVDSTAADGAVYAACDSEVTRCDWDENTGVASACATLAGAACPAESRILGVHLDTGDHSTLLISCSHHGILVCPLMQPGGALAPGGCVQRGVDPCGSIGASGFNFALSVDAAGMLLAGCNQHGYVYCAWSVAEGPVSCAKNLGPSPCPAWTKGITQLPSGRTAASCSNGGYRVCGTANPTAPDTALALATCPPVSVAGFTVDGAYLGSPCGSQEVLGVASHGSARLYTCGDKFVYCSCDGRCAATGSEPRDCISVGRRGCAAGAVRGAGFSRDGTKVFIGCSGKVRYCRFDPSGRPSYFASCVDIAGASCPGAARLTGVTAAPDDDEALVLGCSDGQVAVCPLTADLRRAAGGCARRGTSPCGAGSLSAVSFSLAGGLIAGCGQGYSYCHFSTAHGASACTATGLGASPCPLTTAGIAEVSPGRAAVACGSSGVLHCDPPSSPSAAPTSAPTEARGIHEADFCTAAYGAQVWHSSLTQSTWRLDATHSRPEACMFFNEMRTTETKIVEISETNAWMEELSAGQEPERVTGTVIYCDLRTPRAIVWDRSSDGRANSAHVWSRGCYDFTGEWAIDDGRRVRIASNLPTCNLLHNNSHPFSCTSRVSVIHAGTGGAEGGDGQIWGGRTVFAELEVQSTTDGVLVGTPFHTPDVIRFREHTSKSWYKIRDQQGGEGGAAPATQSPVPPTADPTRSPLHTGSWCARFAGKAYLSRNTGAFWCYMVERGTACLFAAFSNVECNGVPLGRFVPVSRAGLEADGRVRGHDEDDSDLRTGVLQNGSTVIHWINDVWAHGCYYGFTGEWLLPDERRVSISSVSSDGCQLRITRLAAGRDTADVATAQVSGAFLTITSDVSPAFSAVARGEVDQGGSVIQFANRVEGQLDSPAPPKWRRVISCGDHYTAVYSGRDRWEPVLCAPGGTTTTISTCQESGSIKDSTIDGACENDDFNDNDDGVPGRYDMCIRSGQVQRAQCTYLARGSECPVVSVGPYEGFPPEWGVLPVTVTCVEPTTGFPTQAKTGFPTRTGFPIRTGFPSTGFPTRTGFPVKTGFPTRTGFPTKTGFPTRTGFPTGFPRWNAGSSTGFPSKSPIVPTGYPSASPTGFPSAVPTGYPTGGSR